ncbi:DUF6544 family protein [Ideonella sp. BN130291]|uniref:DUF6544 family protein n=1 Tax=Ideonella sp. BN130291 TaxID=3112940 RepID=UPI002E254BDE|nr:DUF6544 family protein [Ideonella sp. BN130291]
MKWIVGLLLLAVATAACLQYGRWSADRAEAERAWASLLRPTMPLPERFDPAMVASLPEPARRYFGHAIQPGTRLSAVVEIHMEGVLSLGSKEDPKYQAMSADQVLAPPHGLVWRVRVGQGLTQVEGSDGMVADRSWTRFWLLRLIPVARAGGDPDHLRSSFGRVVAEAAFWAPAFLLPRPGVEWTALDADTARATVTHGVWRQAVDIRVGPDGQPLWVSLPRWSNANPEQVFRVQPFGGGLSDFREVSGYRLPFRVDGGNLFGTPQYFPFYRARVVGIRVR